MSLSSALQIGRSGILASQTALEVAGNNLANVATPGYHRQTISLTPAQGDQLSRDISIGQGVTVQSITRNISEALEARIRSSISQGSSSKTQIDVLTQLEALENEFTDVDLSSNLSEFFDAWSELANTPDDPSKRTLVIQQGEKLSAFVQDLRSNVVGLRDQVDEQISAAVDSANSVLSQLATVNMEIARVDGGTGSANSLRDERDTLLAELSKYIDISTVEQNDGKVDVFVGSIPLILNGTNRGIELRADAQGDDFEMSIVLGSDGSPLLSTSGTIQGFLEAREEHVNGAIDELDEFANTLIYQVNLLHTQGQGTEGFTSVTGTQQFVDVDAVLNSGDAGLPFEIEHGSFQVTLTQTQTGQQNTTTIDIDLDGIGTDSTMSDVLAQLNSVDNLTASLSPSGRLVIETSGQQYEVSFNEDSSGFLATAGINTYFTGSSAADIGINGLLEDNTNLLAVAQDHVDGDNSNALAIANLRTQELGALGGISLTEMWNRHVEEFAARMGQAESTFQADQIVSSNLNAQQQAISGVNADEEAINLLSFQQAYSGSARFLSVVDEMMQTLLQLL
ncbi:MAG TPA: flagellar hook-associated protein FlgK [Phycisphaerales bacterium]|nr:flagellar hook-associated protein FlgK [Phycisphaerales bacterium]HCD35225.1 flagellar hook-associated protein FlgK [Phycisphaerales bacterium]|tara:strand:+ start:53632 stop:55332 length:1701 start_codon:yes stop_codon:yes gene_type:complete